MEIVNNIKKSLLLILLIVQFGCSEDSTPKNLPPSGFEIEVSDISGTLAKLTWTASTDPEESTVFYDIFLHDEKIIDNITQLSFNLENLEEGINYSGKIVASDPEGNETVVTFSFETAINQPPTPFDVEVLTRDPLFSRINWTGSIDPEGGKIVYNVYLKDELVAEDVTDLYYFFQNLKGITSYSGYVEAMDLDGKTYKSNFSFFTELKVYDRDIRLENQSQVDDFGALCYNKIEGNLIIGSTNTNLTDVSDLSSLHTIQSLEGDIFYLKNTICKNFKGLENIRATHRYAQLNIENNDELLTLEGLEGISQMHEIYISANKKLLNFNGLDNLKAVTNYFSFPYNESLVSIQGLKNLVSVRRLNIGNNDALENLKGLENIKFINELSISSNDGLKSLEGLNNLEACTSLSIESNTALPNLIGLHKLNTVNTLYLSGNSQMINLSGLENLTKVTRSITIQFHENLGTLEGINNVAFTGGTSYGYSLGIHENEKITNLDALIKYRFTDQKGGFSVSSNKELVDYCGLVPLTKDLDASGINTNVIFRWNKFNPTYEGMLNGECTP